MTRLKSLELHGYKTFAARTLFEFAGAITCIVGPNGSGKSNIADSLRWVLGEQSYGLLRGKKTEDMIFAGSEQRARASMASATVGFDNSDGWLPIDFSEVAVTRRAYRDGQNEYLINGQKVRLKDVSELLAQSGLAERTYTIIGQGVVDAALALKAEERRRLFEEAAGIGLHRSRREEALRRLETTRRNLERVQDILAELGPRLRSLERQARRAQEYEQVRSDLRILLREWYGYYWHTAQEELGEARQQAHQHEEALEKARKTQVELDEKLATVRNNLQGLRARLNSWHRQLAGLHTQRETISRERAVAEERRRAILEQQDNNQKDLARLEEELGIQSERQEAAKAEAARLEAEHLEARNQAEQARQALLARQEERTQTEHAVQDARQALANLGTHQERLKARQAERQAQGARQALALESAIQEAEIAKSEAQAASERARSAEMESQAAEERHQQALLALDSARQALAQAESQRQTLMEKRATHETETARVRAQLEVLEQAERALTGYASGAQALLRAAGEARLRGARGALSSQLEVAPEYEAAVAAALGEYLDAIILENQEASEAALDLLASEKARGALLPLQALIPPAAIKKGEVEGLLGMAADVVSVAPELRPAVEVLLGRTLLVRDRIAARRVLARLSEIDDRLRAVTLGGELFYANGPVVAGREELPSTLSRPRQRKSLSQELERTEQAVDALELLIENAEDQIHASQEDLAAQERAENTARQAAQKAQSAYNQARASAEQAERQHRWQSEQIERLRADLKAAQGDTDHITAELTDLDEKIEAAKLSVRQTSEALAALSLDELRSEASYWNTQAAVADRAASDAQMRLSDRQTAMQAAQNTLIGAQARADELVNALQGLDRDKNLQRQSESEISAQIEALRALIDPEEAELDKLEESQESLQNSEATARQAVSKAEHTHAQARINLARRQEAVETWRRRIEDDFGLVAFEYAEEVSGPTPLPLDGMVEQLPRIPSIAPELEDNLRRQRALLRRMGAVNPEAQSEFREVKERYEFMTAQVSDLTQAETDVRNVIAELDELMQQELRRTFDAVADEFGAIFKRLFGGGSARLLLTDPDDMNNTGIEIEARLPGRRSQGLSLLSGGERSLTATALVFALLKVSPTPFCLLDEVDAMLDEANVGRFRDLLRELSQHTQFIVVTHNRNTVQAADVIYGVTMGRDSSSQVISLKLDEIEKVVE